MSSPETEGKPVPSFFVSDEQREEADKNPCSKEGTGKITISGADFEALSIQQLEINIYERLKQKLRDEENCRDQVAPEVPEGNHLFWNINAMSVLCWKGWDWPINATWNSAAQHFEDSITKSPLRHRSKFQYLTEAHLLRYLLCIFPLFLVIMECNTLAGLNDQGSTLKRMIYGDGYYYSPLWTYPMTRSSRDRFRPALSANGTQVAIRKADSGVELRIVG